MASEKPERASHDPKMANRISQDQMRAFENLHETWSWSMMTGFTVLLLLFVFIAPIWATDTLTVETTSVGVWTHYSGQLFLDELFLDEGKVPFADREGRLWWTIEYGLPGLVFDDTPGLVCFDGTTWITYTHDDGLMRGSVNAIAQAPDGTIWCAGEYQGLADIARFDGKKWERFSTEGYEDVKWQELIPGSDFLGGHMVIDHDGLIIIQTQPHEVERWTPLFNDPTLGGDGIIIFDPSWIATADTTNSGPWGFITHSEGLIHNRVYDLGVATDSSLWVATLTGVSAYHPTTGWMSMHEGDVLGNKKIYGILPAQNGEVWLTHGSSSPSVFDGTEWRRINKHGEMPIDNVRGIVQTPDGAIWLGAHRDDLQSGLVRYRNNAWLRLTSTDGLPGDYVHQLTAASDGTLWLLVPHKFEGWDSFVRFSISWLWLLALVFFLIGLYNPRIIIRWGTKRTRGRASGYMLAMITLIFILTYYIAVPVDQMHVIRFNPGGLNLATIAGRVTDRATGEALPQVAIRVEDKSGQNKASAVTDNNGSYRLEVTPGTHRILIAHAQGGQPRSVSVDANSVHTDIDFSIGTIRPPFVLNLDGLWHYHKGDNKAWANPDFDDSDWPLVRSVYAESETIGWFRRHLGEEELLQNRVLLMRLFQSGASEIYLNGRMLYQVGRVSETDEVRERALLPKVIALEDRSDHVVAVRYVNSGASQDIERDVVPGFSIRLLDVNAGIENTSNYARIATIKLVWVGVLSTFGLLHLFLYIFYPRSQGNLYYALFTGLLAMRYLIYYQLSFETNLEHYQTLHNLSMAIDPLIFTGAQIFLYTLFSIRRPKAFWGFLVTSFGFAIWIFSEGLMAEDTWAFYGCWAFLAITALDCARIIVTAVVEKRDGAWIGGIGMVCLITGLSLGASIGGDSDLRSESSEIWALEDTVSAGGVLGLLISMSILLARHVARTNQNLEQRLVEVQELTDKNMAQERALRVEMEKELHTAQQMQMSLMPSEHPHLESFDIAGRCISASHVGGDFYQYFHQEGKFSLTLADVTGHGMEAAIPVVMFSGILDTQIRRGGSIDKLFTELNQALHRNLDRRTFVCFAMGELDPITRTFCLANGGCPYPYHYQAVTGEIVELQADAYPLGVRPDTVYPLVTVKLAPGDRVIFCSDGIIEADNADGELLGYAKTVETIRQACQDGLSAETTIDQILKTVSDFKGDAPQSDDMTCVVLRVEEDPLDV